LADTFRVADDFVILRTTSRSVREFLALFDFTSLAEQFGLDYLSEGRRVVILRAPGEGSLHIVDDQGRCRLEVQFDPRAGYESRGGIEYPAEGLRVVGVWELVEGALRESCVEKVVLPPR
jgi:hypothetical protein